MKNKIVLLLLCLVCSAFALTSSVFANDNTPDLSKYTTTYSTDGDVFVVTNTHIREMIEDGLTGSILWDDANNQDGIRPTQVTIQVYDGEDLVANKSYDLTSSDANESNENIWEHLFDELPKFKNVGETIDYTIQVTTEAPTGYTFTFDPEENKYQTTATHIPSTENPMTVSVVFIDDNNRDGIRPSAVNVTLKQNGSAYGTAVEFSDTNEWENEFTGMPSYVAGSTGVAATYTADLAAAVSGYTASFNSSTGVLTLTHEPAVKSVTVRKVWSDEDNADGYRTSSVCIVLQGDTIDYNHELTSTNIVSGNTNTWEYTFTNVHVNKEGNPISYSIVESGATCAAGSGE